MAKNKNQKNNANITQQKKKVETTTHVENSIKNTPRGIIDLLKIKWVPYVIFTLLGFLLYANTFNASFALDDDIVICKNEYVLQGVSGFPDIFTKDLFDSFYKQMNTSAQLSGGRYRPLSVATFAIEQEFIGTRDNANFEKNCWDTNKNGIEDASEDINKDGLFNDKDCRSKGFGIRHINNAIFYILCICILYYFLLNVVFKGNTLLSFIIALLFMAHPIHTEVVANVKSRDEILSLLFMLGTLIMLYKYTVHKKSIWLFYTSLSFLAAMLSKEYGATLLILAPLSLYLFADYKKLNQYIPVMLVLLVTFIFYYYLRSGVVIGKSNLQDNELMNNPYLLASDNEKLATKLFIFLKYLALQIFPHPLSSDYGYNCIPYKNFGNPEVLLSIVVLAAMIVGTIYAYKKKNWVSFALAFYILNILLVTNLIFNVGATMGERLVFHSSLGFCMLLGYGIYYLAKKMNNTSIALYVSIPLILAYSVKTIARNKAWDSDISLALTDVKTMPNSVSLNGNAASRHLDLSELPKNKAQEKELVRKSIDYGLKAVSLHKGFVNGYLNLGLAYAKAQVFDSARICWDIAFKMYPSHPSKNLYFNLLAEQMYIKGYNLGGNKAWKEGQMWLQKAVEINPNNARWWYDLGGFAYNAQDFATAKMAWAKAYQLNPSDPEILNVQGIFK